MQHPACLTFAVDVAHKVKCDKFFGIFGLSMAGMDRTFEAVYLSVCLSVCPQHNSKTNDCKVFKLSIGNDLGIS